MSGICKQCTLLSSMPGSMSMPLRRSRIHLGGGGAGAIKRSEIHDSNEQKPSNVAHATLLMPRMGKSTIHGGIWRVTWWPTLPERRPRKTNFEAYWRDGLKRIQTCARQGLLQAPRWGRQGRHSLTLCWSVSPGWVRQGTQGRRARQAPPAPSPPPTATSSSCPAPTDS